MWPWISSSSLAWLKFCDVHSKTAMVEVIGEQHDGVRMPAIHGRKATSELCGDTAAIASGCVVVRLFFALACKLPMEYPAALHKRSHETHATDNALVAGMKEPRVPPKHVGVGGADMQRVAGMR